MKTNLEIALQYLKRGYSIFPCNKDKRPLVSWEKYQKELADEKEVISWWSKWPDANIGLATGRLSKIAVIDIDKNKETGELANFDFLPETLTAITGSGGRHLYYEYPEDEDVFNSASVIAPNIDVRGEGGYVLIPPSVTTKGKYSFIKSEQWNLSNLELFPSKFSEIKKEEANVSMLPKENVFKPATSGSRNQTLAKQIGRLFQANLNQEEVTILAFALNNTFNPPLPEDEVLTTIKSIRKTDLRNNPDKVEKNTDTVSIEDIQYTEIKRIKTGIKFIDEVSHESPERQLWRYSEITENALSIITGLPNGGKTYLALTIMANMAIQGHKSLFISLEMNQNEIKARWETLKSLSKTTFTKDSVHLQIEEDGYKSTAWVKTICEKAKKRGFDTVFLDNLDFLTYVTDEKISDNEKQKRIITDIRDIAKKVGINFFLIAHTRKGNGFDMQEIAGSSYVARLADIILIVKRLAESEACGKSVDPKQMGASKYTPITAVKLDKNRNGPSKYTGYTMLYNGKLRQIDWDIKDPIDQVTLLSKIIKDDVSSNEITELVNKNLPKEEPKDIISNIDDFTNYLNEKNTIQTQDEF